MGREVRRVPPNWNHPKKLHKLSGEIRHQPMFDQTYADALQEWNEGLAAWERGERPEYFTARDNPSDDDYWEYTGGPPDPEYHRPWQDHEATWFQLWETVSEGTPVSPPFATAEELIVHLAENGDDWDQDRENERDSQPTGWGMDRARAFVEAGWAPSGAILDGVLMESKDIPLAISSKP